MQQKRDGLLERFRRRLQSNDLIQDGDRLVLAVSGGVDSRVMLDLFARVRAERNLRLALGHVQHHWRGAEAEADAALVASLAEAYGLPYYRRDIEVENYAAKQKLSRETAGRELRYQALDEICREIGAGAIVTAHTQDDQAETILAHLLRGSGLRGLRGMAEHSVLPNVQAPILRPLLNFSREEILAYAQQRELMWREDRSNADTRFYRNRVRHELLPLLRARFNPQINRSLSRLAAISAQTENFLQHSAEQALAEAQIHRKTGKITLDLQRFWNYFRAVQAYVIRAVMEQLTGSATHLTFDETEQILSFLSPTHNQPLAFSRRRYLWRSEVEIYIEKAGVVFCKIRPTPQTKFINIGQRCVLSEVGLALIIAHTDHTKQWRERSHAHMQFADAQNISGPLRVRFPKAGDRFMPLGMRGFKKLSDFFIDLKVPFAQRARVPLLECDAGIIWVCGHRLDERFKITPQTREVLQLQLEESSLSEGG